MLLFLGLGGVYLGSPPILIPSSAPRAGCSDAF